MKTPACWTLRKDKDAHVLKTKRGVIQARDIVVATGFPIKDPSFFFARMTQKRGYVLALRLNGEVPEDMYITPSEPFVSLRSQPTAGGRYLLFGGQGHPAGYSGSTIERYRLLEEFARKSFNVKSIDYRWSTQDTVSIDGVPYIGRASHKTDRLYVATGFAGWGMAHSMVAAQIISDMIQNRENPFAQVYDPVRFEVSDIGKLISQNSEAAGHLAFDKTKQEKQKTCTHMGCILNWNDGEESWDCPCHGSRFERAGQVIQAPATRELK
jgi:glycine/D-amino acid oxidase-like deaminating enzyme